MADELIDILDKSGNPTGNVQLKSKAHQLGLYHASAHIWFYTKDGQLLFQKRVDNKDTFPGLWDVSVAGHIGTGEKPIDAAVREIQEEIGLTVCNEDLDFIGIYLAEKKPKPYLFDNEFHHIYLAKLSVSTDHLILQKEEVSDIKLIPISDFKNILKHSALIKEFVPHDDVYYNLILTSILDRLR
ncbi:NUDIX hydrolase [Aquimarina sp. 2201CG5-10]|uniref:NUDIX hydrolase n=1 Tax=Aquimarina callyspongiae TaxID=3098150 RepID=UPI002AB4E646|nr:NUDIX domain-containing protein [Aquimarina sp. 2201CG5-10]MDY8138951.1 NUDIX domain-containing protein [Aquimarina sp. 2201CG5-10]